MSIIPVLQQNIQTVSVNVYIIPINSGELCMCYILCDKNEPKPGVLYVSFWMVFLLGSQVAEILGK